MIGCANSISDVRPCAQVDIYGVEFSWERLAPVCKMEPQRGDSRGTQYDKVSVTLTVV
jgi:hypothetical protein